LFSTYFPKDSFKKILLAIRNAWAERRNELYQTAESVHDYLENTSKAIYSVSLFSPEGEPPSVSSSEPLPDIPFMEEVLLQYIDHCAEHFDVNFGGFQLNGPKFPPSVTLQLLLRLYHRTKDKMCLQMVEATLIRMAYGGLFDHLGRGFYRYSTDNEW